MKNFKVKVLGAAVGALGTLPITVRSALGYALGSLLGLIPSRDRLVARLQLSRFMGLETNRAVIRRMYASLGQTIFESLNLRPLLSRHERYVSADDDLVEAFDLVAQKRGIVALVAHTGNWDLLGSYMVTRGFPVMTVAREIRNATAQQLVSELRDRFGMRTVWRADRNGLKAIVQELRDGRNVAALIDQDTRVTSTFAEFFGTPARTPSALVEIGKKLNCNFVSAFIVRTGFMRFEVCVRAIDPNLSTEKILETYNSRLEQIIRRHPHQWVWFHKRWRTKQNGERMSSSEYLEYLGSR